MKQELTRYQFEVLTFLERSGPVEYVVRFFSDILKISGSEIERCMDEMTSKGYIKSDNSFVCITESGLEALEPYRVKRALILAAGLGQRMNPATLDRPKPMVRVNGTHIIETLLDALVDVGITDITLVRGYKKEKFDALMAKYPFLRLVDNPYFETTNNISSVMLALDKLDACYLCEADLYISNPQVITKYQYSSNILGSYSLETDDWSFQMVDGYITDYQKGNTYCYNYYGISYWTPEDSKKLREDFFDVYHNFENGTQYFWEFVPLVLLKDNYKVEIRQVQKSDIIEIDSYHELELIDPSYKDKFPSDF